MLANNPMIEKQIMREKEKEKEQKKRIVSALVNIEGHLKSIADSLKKKRDK